jgi:adenylate kinase
MLNIVLLGAQGSGKSTQARILVKHFHLTHIDMGAALRMISQRDSDLGRRVNEIVNVRKELVPDELIAQILQVVVGGINANKGIILDGAPRKQTQIVTVENALAVHQRSIDRVIFIDIPKEVSIARIASRFACSLCKKTFVLEEKNRAGLLECVDCGGRLEQRIDDTPEGVRKRLEVFEAETLPVIEHYREQGKLLRVDGTQDIEVIAASIQSGLMGE